MLLSISCQFSRGLLIHMHGLLYISFAVEAPETQRAQSFKPHYIQLHLGRARSSSVDCFFFHFGRTIITSKLGRSVKTLLQQGWSPPSVLLMLALIDPLCSPRTALQPSAAFVLLQLLRSPSVFYSSASSPLHSHPQTFADLYSAFWLHKQLFAHFNILALATCSSPLQPLLCSPFSLSSSLLLYSCSSDLPSTTSYVDT